MGIPVQKKAMIKQYIVNVWWTIFPSPQTFARPQIGLCGGERSLSRSRLHFHRTHFAMSTQARVSVKCIRRQFQFILFVTWLGGWSAELAIFVGFECLISENSSSPTPGFYKSHQLSFLTYFARYSNKTVSATAEKSVMVEAWHTRTSIAARRRNTRGLK